MPLGRELEEQLREFYNRLESGPLEPDDPLYEPLIPKLHRGGDAVDALRQGLTWSKAASVHLLSGQRGSGKSTELRRLRQLLRNQGYEVFLCDMREYMNLTKPVEITDFLISVVGALNDVVRNDPKYSKDFSREGYWERLTNFLNAEVQLNGLRLRGPLEISASLREDTTFKSKLQQGLRGHVAELVRQAHQFTSEVVAEVRRISKDKDKKVVLLVDSLEQIRGVGYEEAELVHKSVENLFSGHASALRFPLLYVVYTIPPYLMPLAPGLGRLLGGGTIVNLPSVRVRKRNGEEDFEGLGLMKSLMLRRHEICRQAFTDQQIQRMALSTGGDLRDLFLLTRDCLIKLAIKADATLPMPDSIITDAESHMRRDMLPLPLEDKRWLKKIAQTKEPQFDSIQRPPHLARFFDTHLVLNYRNGDDWYDVHPLLREEVMKVEDLPEAEAKPQ